MPWIARFSGSKATWSIPRVNHQGWKALWQRLLWLSKEPVQFVSAPLQVSRSLSWVRNPGVRIYPSFWLLKCSALREESFLPRECSPTRIYQIWRQIGSTVGQIGWPPAHLHLVRIKADVRSGPWWWLGLMVANLSDVRWGLLSMFQTRRISSNESLLKQSEAEEEEEEEEEGHESPNITHQVNTKMPRIHMNIMCSNGQISMAAWLRVWSYG